MDYALYLVVVDLEVMRSARSPDRNSYAIVLRDNWIFWSR
jgi:hypothetical protein